MAIYDINGNVLNESSIDKAFKYIWSLGGIASATGVCNATSSNRMKTLDYIPKDTSKVVVTDNYEMGLFAWDKDVYVGCWNGSSFVTTGITWASSFDINTLNQTYPFYRYKITAKLKSDANITLAEYTNIIFTVSQISADDIVKSMNGFTDIYSAKKQLINPLVDANMYNNDMNHFATFVHISDTHGDWERYERALDLADFIKADAVCHTGDVVWYYSTDRSDFIADLAKEHNTDFHFCVGNHDSYNLSSEQAVYEKYIEPLKDEYDWVVNTNVNYPTYYYKDLTDRNLRIISVNQYQFANQVGTTKVCYHTEQMTFLCNALLNTPANYGVIILIHGVEKAPVLSEGYEKFKSAVTRYNGVQSSPIYQIVDAFISGSSINQTISNGSGATPSSYTINANFANKNSGVEFICYMSGHLHTDNIYYVAEATNKQLMLNVACNNAYFDRNKTYSTPAVGSSNDNPYSNEGNDLGRMADTPSQDAINVYCVDRTNKQIKVVRVGARVTYDLSVNRDYMTIPYAD